MLKQNKQILISVVIIILVIIGFVFLFLKLSNRKAVAQSDLPISPSTLQAERIIEVKNYDLALGNKDSKLCSQLVNSSTRDLCFENVATELKDISICEEIKSQEDKDRCIYGIIINKGATAKSIEPCAELKDQLLIDRCQEQLRDNNFCLQENCQ